MTWSPLPETSPASCVDHDLFDCEQVNEAIALQLQDEARALDLFGSQHWLEFDAGEARLCLEHEPVVARIRRLAGFEAVDEQVAAPDLLAVLGDGCARGCCPVVFGDGFVMPWLPYAGRRHVPHTFVVVGVATDRQTLRFVDGYSVQTEWGAAAPVAGDLTAPLVEAIAGRGPLVVRLFERRTGAARVTPDELLSDNAIALTGFDLAANASAFVDHYEAKRSDAAQLEEFTEACWTIERRRRLYAAWLVGQRGRPSGLADVVAEEVLRRWDEANRFCYLALRRARRGTAASEALFEQVLAAGHADAAFGQRLVEAA
jgi:hypothetical protein